MEGFVSQEINDYSQLDDIESILYGQLHHSNVVEYQENLLEETPLTDINCRFGSNPRRYFSSNHYNRSLSNVFERDAHESNVENILNSNQVSNTEHQMEYRQDYQKESFDRNTSCNQNESFNRNTSFNQNVSFHRNESFNPNNSFNQNESFNRDNLFNQASAQNAYMDYFNHQRQPNFHIPQNSVYSFPPIQNQILLNPFNNIVVLPTNSLFINKDKNKKEMQMDKKYKANMKAAKAKRKQLHNIMRSLTKINNKWKSREKDRHAKATIYQMERKIALLKTELRELNGEKKNIGYSKAVENSAKKHFTDKSSFADRQLTFISAETNNCERSKRADVYIVLDECGADTSDVEIVETVPKTIRIGESPIKGDSSATSHSQTQQENDTSTLRSSEAQQNAINNQRTVSILAENSATKVSVETANTVNQSNCTVAEADSNEANSNAGPPRIVISIQNHLAPTDQQDQAQAEAEAKPVTVEAIVETCSKIDVPVLTLQQILDKNRAFLEEKARNGNLFAEAPNVDGKVDGSESTKICRASPQLKKAEGDGAAAIPSGSASFVILSSEDSSNSDDDVVYLGERSMIIVDLDSLDEPPLPLADGGAVAAVETNDDRVAASSTPDLNNDFLAADLNESEAADAFQFNFDLHANDLVGESDVFAKPANRCAASDVAAFETAGKQLDVYETSASETSSELYNAPVFNEIEFPTSSYAEPNLEQFSELITPRRKSNVTLPFEDTSSKDDEEVRKLNKLPDLSHIEVETSSEKRKKLKRKKKKNVEEQEEVPSAEENVKKKKKKSKKASTVPNTPDFSAEDGADDFHSDSEITVKKKKSKSKSVPDFTDSLPSEVTEEYVVSKKKSKSKKSSTVVDSLECIAEEGVCRSDGETNVKKKKKKTKSVIEFDNSLHLEEEEEAAGGDEHVVTKKKTSKSKKGKSASNSEDISDNNNDEIKLRKKKSKKDVNVDQDSALVSTEMEDSLIHDETRRKKRKSGEAIGNKKKKKHKADDFQMDDLPPEEEVEEEDSSQVCTSETVKKSKKNKRSKKKEESVTVTEHNDEEDMMCDTTMNANNDSYSIEDLPDESSSTNRVRETVKKGKKHKRNKSKEENAIGLEPRTEEEEDTMCASANANDDENSAAEVPSVENSSEPPSKKGKKRKENKNRVENATNTATSMPTEKTSGDENKKTSNKDFVKFTNEDKSEVSYIPLSNLQESCVVQIDLTSDTDDVICSVAPAKKRSGDAKKTLPRYDLLLHTTTAQARRKSTKELLLGADSVEAIQRLMPSDPDKWNIIDADRFPARSSAAGGKRCLKCKDRGHIARYCPVRPGPPKCSQCGRRGHVENGCPNSCCTNCGVPTKFYMTYCNGCFHTLEIPCRICNQGGHKAERCPNHWRQFHLTTKLERLVVADPSKRIGTLKPREQRWCCGCAERGHFEHECQSVIRQHCSTDPQVKYLLNIFERAAPAQPPQSAHAPSASAASAGPPTRALTTQRDFPVYYVSRLHMKLMKEFYKMFRQSYPDAPFLFLTEKVPGAGRGGFIKFTNLSTAKADIVGVFERVLALSRERYYGLKLGQHRRLLPLAERSLQSIHPFKFDKTVDLCAVYGRICAVERFVKQQMALDKGTQALFQFVSEYADLEDDFVQLNKYIFGFNHKWTDSCFYDSLCQSHQAFANCKGGKQKTTVPGYLKANRDKLLEGYEAIFTTGRYFTHDYVQLIAFCNQAQVEQVKWNVDCFTSKHLDALQAQFCK